MSNNQDKQDEYGISFEKMIVEQFRSIRDYEKALFKCAILLNGAATIAVLAFIGSIWSTEEDKYVVIALTITLMYFTAGLVAAAGGLFFGYITSISGLSAIQEAKIKGIKIEDVYSTNFKLVKIKATVELPILYLCALLFLVTSFGTFMYGTHEVTNAFFDHYGIQLDGEDIIGEDIHGEKIDTPIQPPSAKTSN